MMSKLSNLPPGCSVFDEHINPQKDTYASVVKMGRLTCGFQKGHGVVRHAIPMDDYFFGCKGKALCGTQPGRRSVGWVNDEEVTEVTCARCLGKMRKITND